MDAGGDQPTTHSPAARTVNRSAVGPPIDYSFKELKELNDILFEEPVSGRPKHPPLNQEEETVFDYLDRIMGEDRPMSDGRLNSNSLRICNNMLGKLTGLDRVTYHMLDVPSELTWLDASCNKLTSVDDVLLKFPKLQVLYLHGNMINSMHDVLKLAKLEHLTKLTLHGNPIAETKNYKNWVLARLPHLKSLDFSTITRLERDKVDVWWRAYTKQQAAKE